MTFLKQLFSPRVVMVVAGLGLVVLFVGEWLKTGATSEWTRPEEREAVDFHSDLRTLDGSRLELDTLRGQVVMLNFWATWCRPCREEMPSLARLHEKLADRGLRILAVSEELAETIEPYLEQNSFPFQVVRDPGGDLTSEIGVLVLPSTLLIDRQSRLVLGHQGLEEWDRPELLERFEKLLAEP